MDGIVGFSASNLSEINPPRYSDCRLVKLYKGVKKCERNFSFSEVGDHGCCSTH